MVSAILESKMLIPATIESARNRLETLPRSEEINRLLKEICQQIREVSKEDFIPENKHKIEGLLKTKLEILDPNYENTLSLQMLISDSKIREREDNKKKSSATLPSTSTDFSFSCEKVGEQNIIKFKIKDPEDSDGNPAISSGDPGKFDYNKLLKPEEKYDASAYNDKTEQDNILKLLKLASDATKNKFQGLDDNFFIAVMKVASKHSGIARIDEETFDKDFNQALKEIDLNLKKEEYSLQGDNTSYEIAKFFSANFQELSREKNYLTARPGVPEDPINKVGRRLFRVCTEENIEAFKDTLKSPSKSPKTLGLKTTAMAPSIERE
jgi:hypothetical protein